MKYAVILGSNTFIATTGVLGYVSDGKVKEFIKVNEIYRVLSSGSYLAINVDIKDEDGVREVKLFKSKPVVEGSVLVEHTKKKTTVKRDDGTTVIEVEQLDPEDPSITGRSKELIDKNPVDAILRITGNFSVDGHRINATNEKMEIDTNTIMGGFTTGTGGLILTQTGFSFG